MSSANEFDTLPEAFAEMFSEVDIAAMANVFHAAVDVWIHCARDLDARVREHNSGAGKAHGQDVRLMAVVRAAARLEVAADMLDGALLDSNHSLADSVATRWDFHVALDTKTGLLACPDIIPTEAALRKVAAVL